MTQRRLVSTQGHKYAPPVVIEHAFCPECGMPASIDGYRSCVHIDVAPASRHQATPADPPRSWRSATTALELCANLAWA